MQPLRNCLGTVGLAMVLACASFVNAQSGAGSVSAILVTPLDAKLTKPGDPVEVRLDEGLANAGQPALAKGSKLVGHIVAVKARNSDHGTSELVIGFDKAIDTQGKETAASASIASIVRPEGAMPPADAATGGPGATAPSAGSPAPVAGSGRGGGAGEAQKSSDQKNNDKPAQFTLQPRDNGTVISSNSHNVHFDAGTHLLLKVQLQGKK